MRQQGVKRVGATKERCGFSTASAGMENATAGSEASRSTEGALRIFHGFSWNGKCDSRERSESEHRRCVADFPQLQLERKMRQQGAKRVGAPKVRCGFSTASAGMENATAGSEASRSTEGALQRSLTLTPPPAATLSSLPCKSPYGSLGRMAFFPSFSWSGKCDSSGGKPPTLTLQQATACLLSVLPSGSPMALRAKRHGLKSCGSRMGLSAICFANRDKSPSEASRSDEGALQHSLRSFLRLRLRLEAYPSELVS